MGKITVSIICTNYNKGAWIKDAIESFLIQKTDFAYEIILIDDKSTDESVDIIRDYAEKYPKKIRAFYNDKNLGITRTWIKICKEAKGEYIARCDGDDYWLDENKLSKQVAALKNNKNSKWCNTDSDIVDLKGKVTQPKIFANNIVTLPSSYEEMISAKGFTMASTWLVETKLMQEVASGINPESIDDTFSMQLDLFNKTTLTFLPDSTTAYRMHEGSDSRPVSLEKLRAREDRLLQTQLEYIDKYQDVGYRKIIEYLLYANLRLEREKSATKKTLNNRESQVQNLQKEIKDMKKALNYRFASAVRRSMKKVKESIQPGGEL